MSQTPKIGNDGEFKEDVPVYEWKQLQYRHNSVKAKIDHHVPSRSRVQLQRRMGKWGWWFIMLVFSLVVILMGVIFLASIPPFTPIKIAMADIKETCTLAEITAYTDVLVVGDGDYLSAITPEGEALCKTPVDDNMGRKLPLLSPDHQYIAFVQLDSATTQTNTLFVRNVHEQAATSIRHNFGGSLLSWSPDGQWLLYTSDQYIYIINPWAGPGSTTRIAKGRSPLWANGSQIAYWKRIRQRSYSDNIYDYSNYVDHYAYALWRTDFITQESEEVYCCETTTYAVRAIDGGKSFIIGDMQYDPASQTSKGIRVSSINGWVQSPDGTKFVKISVSRERTSITTYNLKTRNRWNVAILDQPIVGIAWW